MFQPGQSGNPNGRPKGKSNAITQDIKDAFAMVLQNRLPDLELWITQTAQNDPAKAVELMIKLSTRFLPELARTEVTGKDGEPFSFTFKFGSKPALDEPEETKELEW